MKQRLLLIVVVCLQSKEIISDEYILSAYLCPKNVMTYYILIFQPHLTVS